MYNATYFEAVFTDIQDAKIWYNEQKEGLEIEFALAIEIAIQKILAMPTSYTLRHKMFVLLIQKHFHIIFIFILIKIIKM